MLISFRALVLSLCLVLSVSCEVSLFVYVSVSPVMPLFSSVKFLCLSLSVCFPISLIT